MAKTLKQLMEQLPLEEQAAIKARTAELVAQEMTLREIRKSLQLTQVQMAAAMNVAQDKISALENRDDALVSTLRKAAGAMGAHLKLVMTFPDKRSIVLKGFTGGRSTPKRKKSAKTAENRPPKAMAAN